MYCYCKWSVLEFPDMIMSTDEFWNQWNNLKDHGAVGQESWWWSCFQVNFFSSVMCWAVQSCMPHRNSKSILKQVIQLCDNFCSNICPYAFTTHIVKGSVQWTNLMQQWVCVWYLKIKGVYMVIVFVSFL